MVGTSMFTFSGTHSAELKQLANDDDEMNLSAPLFGELILYFNEFCRTQRPAELFTSA